VAFAWLLVTNVYDQDEEKLMSIFVTMRETEDRLIANDRPVKKNIYQIINNSF